MNIKAVIPQLRTTDMSSSIAFYTEKLDFTVEFNYEGFYVGVRAGDHLIHLKLVDERDPSISYVDEGGHLHLYFQTVDVNGFAEQLKSRGVEMLEDVHNTAWNTRGFVIHDDQGHTLYFGEPL
jgi:catechol 2,3-dioxygenase-like lactoylglutathione lyase family enzyme